MQMEARLTVQDQSTVSESQMASTEGKEQLCYEVSRDK